MRDQSGANRADSVEYAAAREARSKSFLGGIIVAAVVIVAAAFFPTHPPVFWLVGFLALYLIAFWARYSRILKELNG